MPDSPPTPPPVRPASASSPMPFPAETVPERIDPEHTTAPRSPAELKALLAARKSDLLFHVEALKDELSNPSSITVDGQPLPDALRDNAVRYAAIALSAGLALGALWGLVRRRGRRPVPQHDLDLVRAKFSSFLDDAAEHVRRGASPDEAVRRTLRDTPVVYAPAPEIGAVGQAKSSVRQAVDLAVKSAFGFAIKAGTDQLTQKLTGKTDTLDAIAEAP